MIDPKLSYMDAEIFADILDDTLAEDENGEFSELTIHRDTIRLCDPEDGAYWMCDAEDERCCYTIFVYDMELRISYSGTK